MKKTGVILAILIALLTTRPGFLAAERPSKTDARDLMREFVTGISASAKKIKPGFLVIPQNGLELLSRDGNPEGHPATDYIRAIDGIGCEELFYGYDGDDRPTPVPEQNRMTAFLENASRQGLRILVTDYCSNRNHVKESSRKNSARGFLSFAADRRELDGIPAYPRTIAGANTRDIRTLSDASNFLYIINPGDFPDKISFLHALKKTDYDLIILDPFFDTDNPLTVRDVRTIRKKNNGGSRLLIAYLSIGEAEDYRYYWKSSWRPGQPRWIEAQNPDWEGNYRIQYWDPEWQDIIAGSGQSYVRRVLNAGFDGVYLDKVDAYGDFE